MAIALAIVLGYVDPARAVAMKPLGDAFIRLITMIITSDHLLYRCRWHCWHEGPEEGWPCRWHRPHLFRGRLHGRSPDWTCLWATSFGPGDGFNVNAANLDSKAVSDYAGQAKAQSVTEFLLHIIPTTAVDAFAKGDILEVVFVALLFGFALAAAGPRGKPLVDFVDSLTHVVFEVTRMLMKFAPIGAFGAMAYTVGKFGVASLGPLAKLIGTFWITSILFVVIVLGAICWAAGFSLFRFLSYIKEEILLVLAVSSSEIAIPTLMAKLEKLGCSKSLVGLVVPTGFTFNTDGTGLYMTLAALFVAQATNTHLTMTQQFTIVAVAVLTSKGASGVQGASFIALVATLSVIPAIPIAGMALILGIDRFMSMFRALVNMIGNGVATLVMARLDGELDRQTLKRNIG